MGLHPMTGKLKICTSHFLTVFPMNSESVCVCARRGSISCPLDSILKSTATERRGGGDLKAKQKPLQAVALLSHA